MPSGFQIIVDSNRGQKNPRYAGIGLVPSVPSGLAEESAVLDEYVFGDYKDSDSNLIPAFARAVELLSQLKRSPRIFSLVTWSSGPDDPFLKAAVPRSASLVHRGFDVANVATDCWSIVQDLPVGEWVARHSSSLNEFGLFPDHRVAAQYLDEYRRRREADWDCAFQIGLVSGVRT
jgi:hypothetical protein